MEKSLQLKRVKFGEEELNKSKNSIRCKSPLKSQNTIKSKKTINRKNTIKSKKSIKSRKTNKTKKTYKELRNTIISNCFIKFNTLKSKVTKEKGSIVDTQKNSSIYPLGYFKNTLKSIFDSNKSVSNVLSSRFNNDIKKSFSKNEKLLYNVFTNLTTTQEKSFQLNSSYDNINIISNNKYIKDINLQSKVKQVLIGQYPDPSPKPIKKKNSFLMAPINTPETFKQRKSFVKRRSINESISEDEFNKFRSTNNENGDENNILKSMTLKSKNGNGDNFLSLKKPKKQVFLSSSKLIDISRNAKLKKTTKSPNIENKKVKKKMTKKKPEKINQQLNIISKNIENTSKNINNPEEFYMNFFTNIIAKKTKSVNGDEKAENNVDNMLSPNSGEVSVSNNTKRRSSKYLNILDSASKESNTNNSNLNLLKVKQKSGFGSKI